MRRLLAILLSCLIGTTLAQTTQTVAPGPTETAAAEPVAIVRNNAVIPSGTKVLMVMKNTVTSKNARQGDGVYLETTFPVVDNGRVVIPAGTYVQGVVDSVRRSGRIKGRAEILLHFTTLIYPNGYTLLLPGAVNSADGNDGQRVKDDEGTVQADGNKGRDAATVATSAGTGAVIGGLSHGGKGAGIGGGIGAAVGVATAMLTRGDEVRLASGTSVEMVLQRAVTVDMDRISGTNRQATTPPPQPPGKKSERPVLTVPGQGPIVR
jgi:hypothetical protein